MNKMRRSKWSKAISICLIVIGGWMFLAGVSCLAGVDQRVNHAVDEAARLVNYHFDKEEIQIMKTTLWHDALKQLLIGCWIIVCGIGLYLFKRWAWYLTIVLTICGSVHGCYGIYIGLYYFDSIDCFILPVIEFMLSLSILILLILKRHEYIYQHPSKLPQADISQGMTSKNDSI